MRQNKTSCLKNWIQFEIALILENDLKAVGIVKDNVFRFAVFFSMFVVFASKYVDKRDVQTIILYYDHIC